MKELQYESWTSSSGRKEIHVFIKGTDTYVFGYNPDYINKEMIEKILKEYEVTGERDYRRGGDGC